MTNRLTQDCLENLFSFIRAMGAANDQPSALNLQYRLRWYLLGKHAFDVLSNSVNTEVDGSEDNLIDFNNRDEPLMALAFDENSDTSADPVFDNEEFDEFNDKFQNEDFVDNDTNELEDDEAGE